MTANHSPTLAERQDELGLRVVDAVAEADGVEPTTLEPPLHDVIDAEALDRLFASTPTETRVGTVRFDYRDHDVTVQADGTVDVA